MINNLLAPLGEGFLPNTFHIEIEKFWLKDWSVWFQECWIGCHFNFLVAAFCAVVSSFVSRSPSNLSFHLCDRDRNKTQQPRYFSLLRFNFDGFLLSWRDVTRNFFSSNCYSLTCKFALFCWRCNFLTTDSVDIFDFNLF